jgi:hypothetical protein
VPSRRSGSRKVATWMSSRVIAITERLALYMVQLSALTGACVFGCIPYYRLEGNT